MLSEVGKKRGRGGDKRLSPPDASKGVKGDLIPLPLLGEEEG